MPNPAWTVRLCLLMTVLTSTGLSCFSQFTNPWENASDGILQKARQSSRFRNEEAAFNRELLHTPVILDENITLPVVFHVVGTQPIADELILAALEDLNDAFAHQGKYAISNGIDTKIRFCLAKTAPDGGMTTGINHITSFFGNDINRSIEDAKLKVLSQWDGERYINIWLVSNIQDENFTLYGCTSFNGSQWRRFPTLGYATMPRSRPDSLDGIVVSQTGSVLAHEMGHYLGLYHTFEGGCNNTDCTLNGDRVCDTPPDGSWLPSSCQDPANTCGTDTLSNYSNGIFRVNVPDQVENFMDYNNWDCASMFTNGQAIRMRAAIARFRSGLLKSVCNRPCSDSIVANFTKDKAYPYAGQTVIFSSNSFGAGSYKWYVNDSLAGNSSSFSFLFTNAGQFNIRLEAYSSAGCYASTSETVVVNCGVTARFYPDKKLIASQLGFLTDSILFTNISVNAQSFEWLVENNTGLDLRVVSTAKQLVYTFPMPGLYKIRLVASNGNCHDTTLPYEVPVLDPRPDARPVIYQTDCYETSKIRLVFGVCNSGFTPLLPQAPISFYDADPRKPGAHKLGSSFLLPDTVNGGGGGSCCSPQYTVILDVKRPGLNRVYMSFGDAGLSFPVKFPTGSLLEKNYENNIDVDSLFQFTAAIDPATATLFPGDSLRINASTNPDGSEPTYTWKPGNGLSCVNCASPLLIADSSRTFRVVAQSQYDCFDTAFAKITVRSAHDYSVTIDSIFCGTSADSLQVRFTVYDGYRNPVLPKGLPVAFYQNDPRQRGAVLLQPVFLLGSTFMAAQKSFTTSMKAGGSLQLFAVVNDSAKSLPLSLPNTGYSELDYTNNTHLKKWESISLTATANHPCQGDTIRLQANASQAGASFEWKGPAQFSSKNSNPVFASGSQSAGIYSVTALLNNCRSNEATVAVDLLPAPELEASFNDPVCENGSLQLRATATGASRFAWTGPNGFTSQLQNPAIQPISPENAGVYQVFALGTNGCRSEVKQVNISINSSPTAAFSAPDICLPETRVAFKNESISNTSITRFRWNFGDSASGPLNTDSIEHPTHQFTRGGQYRVTLIVENSAGCRASVSKMYTGLHEQPIANFSIGKPGVCIGDTVSFTDKSSGDAGTINSWTWNMGDSSSPVTQNDNQYPFTYAFTSAGVYTVSLAIKNDFGCQQQVSKQVTVYSLPEVNAGPDQFVLQGRLTQLHANVSPDVTRFLWTPAAGLSDPNSLAPSVNTPLNNLVFILTGINNSQCIASDTVLVKLLLPIKIPNAFSPNGDGVNDTWLIPNLADYPGCNVDIFDRYGKLVFHATGYNQPWNGTVNGSPAPVGVYYYIITPKNDAATVNGSVTLIR